MERFVQRGETIQFTFVKDCSGCFADNRLEWEREKSRAGRPVGRLV